MPEHPGLRCRAQAKQKAAGVIGAKAKGNAKAKMNAKAKARLRRAAGMPDLHMSSLGLWLSPRMWGA